jgi:hypothetical protein
MAAGNMIPLSFTRIPKQVPKRIPLLFRKT